MEDVQLDVAHLERLLECPVCLERFSYPDRKPKGLPCQHTVCERCVTRLAGEMTAATVCSVRCPECCTVHSVPCNGPQNLPNNVMVLSLMSMKVNSICREPGCREKGRTVRCFHCDEKLCPKHLRQHTQDVQRHIIGQVKDLKNYVDRYRTMIAEIQKLSSKCELDSKELKEKVSATMDNLIAELVDKKSALLTEMDNKNKKVILVYSQQETEFKQRATFIEQYCDTLNEIVTTDIITSGSLVGDIQSQCQTHIDTAATETRVLKAHQFKFDFKVPESLVTAISKIGNVTEDVEQIDVSFDMTSTPSSESRHKELSSMSLNKALYEKKGECLMDKRKVTIGDSFVDWTPRGLAVCPSNGDVIVTCHTEPCIYLLDSQLNYLNSFGKIGHQPGHLSYPYGAAVTTTQDIIVCDSGNARLQVMSKSGEVIRLITWPEEMNEPCGVVLDVSDNMYVTDYQFHHVLVFDVSGQHLSTIGSEGTSPGQFELPYSIAIRGSNLVVSTDSLQVIDSQGTPRCCVREGEGELAQPRGVCVDNCGHILVVDVGDGCVKVFTEQGEFVCRINMTNFEQNSDVFTDSFMAVTGDGRVLVTNSFSNSLLVY